MNHLFNNKIERGEYRMAKHFSDDAKDVISHMLAVDPTARYTLEQVITHPWFRVGCLRDRCSACRGCSCIMRWI